MLDEIKDVNVLHLDDVCSYFQVKWRDVKKKKKRMYIKFKFILYFICKHKTLIWTGEVWTGAVYLLVFSLCV